MDHCLTKMCTKTSFGRGRAVEVVPQRRGALLIAARSYATIRVSNGTFVLLKIGLVENLDMKKENTPRSVIPYA